MKTKICKFCERECTPWLYNPILKFHLCIRCADEASISRLIENHEKLLEFVKDLAACPDNLKSKLDSNWVDTAKELLKEIGELE